MRVEFSLEDMDMSRFQSDATYGQIKEHGLEQTGLKVFSIYIAQIKQRYGIIERENYNKQLQTAAMSAGKGNGYHGGIEVF